MDLETITVYKGAQAVVINKTDLEEFRGKGYLTSSERQKASKAKKQDKKV